MLTDYQPQSSSEKAVRKIEPHESKASDIFSKRTAKRMKVHNETMSSRRSGGGTIDISALGEDAQDLTHLKALSVSNKTEITANRKLRRNEHLAVPIFERKKMRLGFAHG